jgi:hypothetical protein
VTRITVACNCGWKYVLTDSYSSEAKGLNRKSVFGSRLMGKGRTGIETMSAILDLPPPVAERSYSDHNKEICEILGRYASRCLLLVG